MYRVENSHGRKPVDSSSPPPRSPIGAIEPIVISRPAGAPILRREAHHGLAPVAILKKQCLSPSLSGFLIGSASHCTYSLGLWFLAFTPAFRLR
jgi:hypothetical protein